MEEDVDMRKLLEQFVSSFYSDFFIKTKNKAVSPDSIVQSRFMTKDFFKHFKDVWNIQKYLTLKKWENFFAISCSKALDSHEVYFRYVFFACEYAIRFSKDVFDGLLIASAVVVNYSIETLINTGANFCGFSVDIIMIFYENTLKEEFYKFGGFERFAEYLSQEYLEWECYYDECNDLTVDRNVAFVNKAYYKIIEELQNMSYEPESNEFDDVIKNNKCQFFAKQLLSSAKIKFPTLPSPDELKITLRNARQQKMDLLRETKRINALVPTRQISGADLRCERTGVDPKNEKTGSSGRPESMKLALKESGADPKNKKTGSSGRPESVKFALKECSNSNSDFKISNITGNDADISYYNKVIRAVIMHNKSKISDAKRGNNGIQNEINKILEPLKDMIKSLIEILDENEF